MDAPTILIYVNYVINFVSGVLVFLHLLILIPWIILFSIHLRYLTIKKEHFNSLRENYNDTSSKKLFDKYMHEYMKIKGFFFAILFELIAISIHLFGGFIFQGATIEPFLRGVGCPLINVVIYWYVFITYGLIIPQYFIIMTLETLNYLTRYYLHYYSQKRQEYRLSRQKKGWIIGFTVLSFSSIPAVGIIPCIIVQPLVLIYSFIKFRIYTNQLFQVLRFKSDDLKFTYGMDDVITKNFASSTKMHKISSMWIAFVIYFIAQTSVIISYFYIPVNILNSCYFEFENRTTNTTFFSDKRFSTFANVVGVLGFLNELGIHILFTPPLLIFSIGYISKRLCYKNRFLKQYNFETRRTT